MNIAMTPSREDYLEAIYDIGRRQGAVRVTDIALRLGIAKPSVNTAIANLKEKGYVRQQKYGAVELTEAGRAAAERIFGKHTAIKRFLEEVLHVPAAVAEEEACRIEHVISEDTVARMVSFTEGD